MMLAIQSSPRQSQAFLHPIGCDTMQPTYVRHLHSVICLPVDQYLCEGVYLFGGSELYRCERQGRYVAMWRDNPSYSRLRVHIDLFNNSQLALVVADITARNVLGVDMLRHSSQP